MQDRTDISVRTRRLAMILRRLRTDAGLSGLTVARRVGISPSVISRAESGKRRIRPDDLAAVLTVYRVPRPLRQALLKLHAEADKPGLLDRGELAVHADLATWIGFEQDATRLRNYEPLYIPGLLQTFPYARAVIENGGKRLSPKEIDNRVAARIDRQRLVREGQPPNLELVLHEAAVRHRVGGANTMRAQLAYLVAAAGWPFVSIRVIPLETGAHPGMDGPFVVMDYAELPSLVHLENKVASLWLDEAVDVEDYKLAFEGLQAVALSPDQSLELIAEIADGIT